MPSPFITQERIAFPLCNRHDLYTFLQCDLVKKQLPAMFITGCGRNEESSSALTAKALPKNVSLSEKNLKLATTKKKNPKANCFGFVDPQILCISGSGTCKLVCMSVPFLVSTSCKSTCLRDCCHHNKVTVKRPRCPVMAGILHNCDVRGEKMSTRSRFWSGWKHFPQLAGADRPVYVGASGEDVASRSSCASSATDPAGSEATPR